MRDGECGPTDRHIRLLRRRQAVALLSGAGSVAITTRLSAQPVDLVIRVELLEDRNQTGVLTLRNAAGSQLAGPFPAFGRGDNATAAAHGNPTRNPTQLYGDTPTGTYDILRAVATGTATNYNDRSYGPNGALVLRPTGGQALAGATNGRVGLLIHGGAPGTGGRLRATHGCVRLSNQDQARLMAAIAAAGQNARFNRCELVRLAASVGPPGDPLSGEDAGDPPPRDPAVAQSRADPPLMRWPGSAPRVSDDDEQRSTSGPPDLHPGNASGRYAGGDMTVHGRERPIVQPVYPDVAGGSAVATRRGLHGATATGLAAASAQAAPLIETLDVDYVDASRRHIRVTLTRSDAAGPQNPLPRSALLGAAIRRALIRRVQMDTTAPGAQRARRQGTSTMAFLEPPDRQQVVSTRSGLMELTRQLTEAAPAHRSRAGSSRWCAADRGRSARRGRPARADSPAR